MPDSFSAPLAATPASIPAGAGFRLGALLYFFDAQGRILLMQRRRPPNLGRWCAVGGKLEMASGESPFECARREAREEVGVDIGDQDLELRCILAERDYEGCGHWLMFVFRVAVPLAGLPACHEEGVFQFFRPEELAATAMPPLDRAILVERVLGSGRDSLHVLRAGPEAASDPSRLVVEERIGGQP